MNDMVILNNSAGIDNAIDKFTELIQSTKISWVLHKSSKVYSPITPKIKRIIQTKNALKCRWQRCKNKHEKHELNKYQKYVDLNVRIDYNSSVAKDLASRTTMPPKL